MRRSITVTPSILVLLAWLVGVAVGLIPEDVDPSSGVWWLIGFLPLAALLRLFILFWQTLGHATQHAPPEGRSGWVIYHVVFGPIASVAYYYAYRSPSPRRVTQDPNRGGPTNADGQTLGAPPPE